MSIRRIVPNIAADDLEPVRAFYMALFDLDVVMDQGWIVTLAADTTGPVHLSIAREGGSGTPVPDLSIEVDDVDDVDDVFVRAQAGGYDIPYGLTLEPWGVRRFFVCDPAGKVLNILSHT